MSYLYDPLTGSGQIDNHDARHPSKKAYKPKLPVLGEYLKTRGTSKPEGVWQTGSYKQKSWLLEGDDRVEEENEEDWRKLMDGFRDELADEEAEMADYMDLLGKNGEMPGWIFPKL
jgi:hypothetical protein